MAAPAGAVQSAVRAIPLLKTPVPDPGVPLQLVHHDDVAAAIALAATTDAPPGAYNIAGDGEVTISDIVTALGGRPVRVPAIAVTAASAVIAHMPFIPSALEVAARRADVGRDGHQQSEIAVGLEAEVHLGGNTAGPRAGGITRSASGVLHGARSLPSTTGEATAGRIVDTRDMAPVGCRR